MIAELSEFIQKKDEQYRQKLALLPLFNPNKTTEWTEAQKKYFTAVFYHLRGYFIDFMWYVANFSNDDNIKKIIIHNIEEELGLGNKTSHEQLYSHFAEECGVNIKDEIIKKTHYLPFAQQFNHGHLNWLNKHNNDAHLAAFAAYERLDNIDYPSLTELACSLNVSDKALKFFKIHMYVEHFDSAVEQLSEIWQKNPQTVVDAFDFIYSHQLKMWDNLSQTVFEYSNKPTA